MFNQVATWFCKVLQTAGFHPGSPQQGGSWLTDVAVLMADLLALFVGKGSALPPLGPEVQFSTSCESSQGCFGVGLAVQEAHTEASSKVSGADAAGCGQVVLIVGSLVSVFKMTNHKVYYKDGELTGTKNRW